MNSRRLQFVLREMHAVLTAPRAWAGFAVVTLVLGLSGPFDTYADFGIAGRLLYWALLGVLTFVVGYFTVLVAMQAVERLPMLPLRLLISGIVAGVPVTATVLAFNLVVYQGRTGMEPLHLWLYCTLISIAVATAMALLGTSTGPDAAQLPTGAASGPPLLERLAPPQRAPLISISVEDHYVEVKTRKGKALLLMRLSDAIRETTGTEGLQIHRSHWVAREAIARVVRSEGRMLVELVDGTRLPVSRSYLGAVRAAGLA